MAVCGRHEVEAPPPGLLLAPEVVEHVLDLPLALVARGRGEELLHDGLEGLEIVVSGRADVGGGSHQGGDIDVFVCPVQSPDLILIVK